MIYKLMNLTTNAWYYKREVLARISQQMLSTIDDNAFEKANAPKYLQDIL